MVLWHEGPETAEYCGAVDDLVPRATRPPSPHGPIRYRSSGDVVAVGDRVFVRYWLFFSGEGTVSYVPGVSPLKRDLERDGLAWVRVKMDRGDVVDTVVIDGALKKNVRKLKG
jgi:hypothetical protein